MTRIVASAIHTRGIDQLNGSLEVVPRYVYQKFKLGSGNLLEMEKVIGQDADTYTVNSKINWVNLGEDIG